MKDGPLDVPCPRCKAIPGFPCADGLRRFVNFHPSRMLKANRHNARMAKRGYSREFTPQTNRRVRFEIDRIPPTLYDAVLAKAKREGISLRALTLTLWKKWIEDPHD